MPPRLLRNLLNSTFQCLSKSIKLDQKKEKRVKIHPFRKKKKVLEYRFESIPYRKVNSAPHWTITTCFSLLFCFLFTALQDLQNLEWCFLCDMSKIFFFVLERFNQNNLTVSGNTTRQEYSIFPMSESWGLSKSSFHVPISKWGLIFPTDFFC